MNNDLNKIGNRFEYFRKDVLKKTQSELAKELETTQKTISLYEQGERIPHSKFIIRMVTKYNLNRDWLFDEKGAPIIKSSDKKISSESALIRIDVLEKRIEKIEELLAKIVEKLG